MANFNITCYAGHGCVMKVTLITTIIIVRLSSWQSPRVTCDMTLKKQQQQYEFSSLWVYRNSSIRLQSSSQYKTSVKSAAGYSKSIKDQNVLIFEL